MSQRNRLERFGVDASVDIHSHLLPGMDDGPATLESSLALCRALVEDGITCAIATPHQLGRFDLTNSAADIRAAVQTLQAALDAQRIPLSVLPGGDVRVDERLPQLLDEGHVMSLADAGVFVLLELPSEIWVQPEPILHRLHASGYRAVLSHPERYTHVQRTPSLANTWVRAGAVLQVTAGSLVGDFGESASATAWALLEAGKVAIIASDAHHPVSRPPRMKAALAAIRRRFGLTMARRLCLENPLTLSLERSSANLAAGEVST